MKKAAVRLSACVLGVAVAFAGLPFVKAQLWASAVCDANVSAIYGQMRDLGWTIEDVQRVADVQALMGITCDSGTVRGAYFDSDGALQVIVRVGDAWYYLNYTVVGTLTSVQ